MYGATRFETASNLPTNQCPGGWEFYELVTLKFREHLRFDVDTAKLRRHVQQIGWYVWDETPTTARRRAEVWQAEGVSRLPEEQYPSDMFEADEIEMEPAAIRAPTTRTPSEPTPKVVPPPTPKVLPPTPRTTSSTTPKVVPPREVTTAAPREPVPPRKVVPPSEVTAAPRETAPPRRTTTPAPRHQVVWFDIPVRDFDRAVRFYSAVLGAQLKKEQAGPGAAIAVLPHPEGSIGGALVLNIDAHPSESGPLLYLNVNGRIDDALDAVERLGGKVLSAKHSIAPFGQRAIVLDSEGNRIALHSM